MEWDVWGLGAGDGYGLRKSMVKARGQSVVSFVSLRWLQEHLVHSILFYKGQCDFATPPTGRRGLRTLPLESRWAGDSFIVNRLQQKLSCVASKPRSWKEMQLHTLFSEALPDEDFSSRVSSPTALRLLCRDEVQTAHTKRPVKRPEATARAGAAYTTRMFQLRPSPDCNHMRDPQDKTA